MDLRDYLQIVIRKLWIILPVLIVTLVATVIYTDRQPLIYNARATYVARLNQVFLDDKNVASALDILSRRTEIATTFSEVAKSRRIKFFAGERLGLPPADRRSVSVNSRVIAGTNIIEISAEGSNPELVRDFTNAVGAETMEYANVLYQAYTLETLDEAITPGSPSRPRKVFNYILGGIVGLALGLGFAFLSETLSMLGKPKGEQPSQEEMETFEEGPMAAQWQREVADLKAQFDLTQQQIEQTRLLLRSTQQDAEAISSSVRSFATWLEGYRTELEEIAERQNGTSG